MVAPPPPRFNDDMRGFLELYFTSERQFLQFDELVPYDRNPDSVYSPVLFPMLQFSGSQVDGLMKAITEQSGIVPKTRNFPERYHALNGKGLLPILKVGTQRGSRALHPFNSDSPAWWVTYNRTKHDLPRGMDSVTLGVTIESLAAVYLLLFLGMVFVGRLTKGATIASRTDFPDFVLNPAHWTDFESDLKADPQRRLQVKRGSEILQIGTVETYASLSPIDFLQTKRRSLLFNYLQWLLPLDT